MPLLHCPSTKSIVDAIDAMKIPGPPTKEVPQEDVSRTGGVFGAEQTFNREPVIVMQLLLLFISQSHQEPILDLLALGQRAAGGIQALEYLLRVLRLTKSDTDHPESLKSLEQAIHAMAGDQASRDPPTLSHASGTGRMAFKTAAVLFLVPILKPQLPALLRWLTRIRKSIVMDDLSGPFVASAFRPELSRDAGQEDAHRRQPLLTIDHPDGFHDSRRSGLRKREKGTAVVRRAGAVARDGHEVLNQPLDVGLPPTVSTLPARHDVLDLSIQKFKELNLLSLHRPVLYNIMSVAGRSTHEMGGRKAP